MFGKGTSYDRVFRSHDGAIHARPLQISDDGALELSRTQVPRERTARRGGTNAIWYSTKEALQWTSKFPLPISYANYSFYTYLHCCLPL
jgi:hypothetical protein